jgi:hypothetical protein
MEMNRTNDDHDSAEARDTLMMFSGMALMVMGAGLVLTTPIVRKYLGGLNVANLLQAAGPDFDRYMKMKAM